MGSTRQRANDLRLQVQYAQDAVIHNLRFFGESRDAYMKSVDRARGESQRMPGLVQQLRTDDENLRQKIEELKTLYNEMTNLDNQLGREDGETLAMESNGIGSPPATGQIIAPSIQTVRNPTYDDFRSEFHVPALLKKYFDVVAELRLAQERLNDELPYEHADQRFRRQRMMDQEQAVSETDDDFEEKCRQEVEDVRREIKDLKDRVNQLHAEVIEAGLDPDPEQYRRKSRSGTSKVAEWLDSVAVEIPVGQFHEDELLAGSTKASRAGSPARKPQTFTDNLTEAEDQPERVFLSVLPSTLDEVTPPPSEPSDHSSSTCGDEEVTKHTTTRSDRELQNSGRENAAELPQMVPKSPKISAHEQPQPSKIATDVSGDRENETVATKGDGVPVIPSGELPQSSTTATLDQQSHDSNAVAAIDDCGLHSSKSTAWHQVDTPHEGLLGDEILGTEDEQLHDVSLCASIR
ncbi:hypothetical protein CBER1_11427 [Cercospora berteroae]|uniref:Uncharacterized protein n=1 Tax=Cercospora berteroae TaxID=357750 RepID=A0A2S6BZX5_9PEZI|nr:hypothetical protein CBER1_11427 [Cercospora berteroae]